MSEFVCSIFMEHALSNALAFAEIPIDILDASAMYDTLFRLVSVKALFSHY